MRWFIIDSVSGDEFFLYKYSLALYNDNMIIIM